MKYYTVTETAVVISEEPPNSGKYLLELAHLGVDNERCATCRMCQDKSGKKVTHAVPGKDVEKSQLVPGAKVVVEVKIPVIYAHILYIFGLPIMGFVVGAGVGYALFGAEGILSLLTVGLGLLGAILLFLAAKPSLGERVRRREDPVIARIADSSGAQEVKNF